MFQNESTKTWKVSILFEWSGMKERTCDFRCEWIGDNFDRLTVPYDRAAVAPTKSLAFESASLNQLIDYGSFRLSCALIGLITSTSLQLRWTYSQILRYLVFIHYGQVLSFHYLPLWNYNSILSVHVSGVKLVLNMQNYFTNHSHGFCSELFINFLGGICKNKRIIGNFENRCLFSPRPAKRAVPEELCIANIPIILCR